MVRDMWVAGAGVAFALALLLVWQYNQPSVGVGALSGPVRVDIIAHDVEDMAGIQADVVYNPSVVHYDGMIKGPFLDGGDTRNSILLNMVDINTPGMVRNIVVLRLQQNGVSGSGVIASVKFSRIAPGDAGVQLKNVLLSNSAARPIDSSEVTPLVVG